MDRDEYKAYIKSGPMYTPAKKDHQHGEKPTTLLSLKSLQETRNFWLANNLVASIPQDDALLCCREDDRNVAHFFLFEYSESSKPLTGEELNDATSTLSLRKLSDKFNCIKQAINGNVPADYTPVHDYKVIVFTNRSVFKGPMFAWKDKRLFSAKSGEVYGLNSELFCNGDEEEFCNFLDCVSLYANQGNVSNLELNIRNCMEEILQGPITEAAMNNYMNYIRNWMQISNKKIGLNYKLITNILEFSVLQSCALPIEIAEKINREIHCSFLWEEIKNKSIFINNSHLAYLTNMISNDVLCNNFNTQDLELSFIANITFNNYKAPNQAYLLACFFGVTPFIIEKCVFVKQFHCKYVPVGSEDSPKNLSKITNNKILQLLEQRIALNCGRNIPLGKLLNDSFDNLLTKLSVSDVLTLLNRERGEFIKTDGILVERKFKAILLQIGVLNNASDDLFVIKMLNFTKQVAIAILKINEAKVCDVQNYESKFNYVFLGEDEDFNNFTKLDSRNVHFVEVIKGNPNFIKWVATSGDVKHIKNFSNHPSCKQDENLINLNEIHNYFRQSFLIISGETGMGKTTALKQIGLNAPQNAWVLYVDLKREENYFKFLLSENSRFNSINCLNNFYKSNGAVLDEIFNLKLKSREVLILIDGFNQVAPKFKMVATKIIKCIRTDGFNVIITTRTSQQNSVETAFGTFSIPLSAFNVNEQEEYLKTFFATDNDELYNNTNVMSIIEQNFGGEFCNTPLNMKLIANILSKNSGYNLLNLYETYVNEIIDIYVRKINNVAVDKQIIEKYYKYYAVKTLLNHTNNYCIIKFAIEHALIILIATLTREGRGFLIADFNEVFLHGTIAEYYIAKWLVDVATLNDTNTNLIKGEKEFCINILKTEILKREFSSVQVFFDLIVNKGCELHEAILAKNFKFAKEIIQNDVKKVREVNKYQQTLLHTIISNCNVDERSYSLNQELVKIIQLLYADYIQILNCKDFLNLTPIDYANLKNDKSLLKINLIEIKGEQNNYFVTYNKPFNLIEFLSAEITNNVSISHLLSVIPTIKEINFDSLVLLVTSGYFCEVVEMLDMPDGMRALDANGNNLLHWAVENNNNNFISHLVSSRYNSNLLSANNKNNYTPLLLAVQFGYLNILKMLVTKVPKLSLKEQDVAIIYAVIGGRVEILNFLINLNYKYQNPLPIYIAFKQRNATLLNYLMTQTISPVQFMNNITYFHYASTYKNKLIIENVLKLHKNPVQTPPVNLPKHYKEWLQKLNDLNAQDNSGLTPLMYAAKHDNTEVVNYLLCNGADLKCRDKEGYTCLHHSVQSGSVNTFTLLCQKDVDINETTSSGCTLLHLAVISRNYEIVPFLIDRTDLNCTDNLGRTILHCAAQRGDREIIDLIRVLCQNNVGIDNKDVEGCTALTLSIMTNNNIEITKLLIAYSDLKSVDTEGCTYMHSAAVKGKKDVIECLLPFTVDINIKANDGRTPLFSGVLSGKLDVVELLIFNGADTNSITNDGSNLLHYAAYKGSKDIIEYLIQFTIDINLKNNEGQTPLFAAIRNGKLDVIEFLISKGSNITTLDKYGNTLLHAAALVGHKNITQYFIPFFTNDLKNHSGQTPLFLAIFSGKLDIVQLLISNGSDVKTADKYGDTLLHIAANKGHEDIIKFLIPFFSDINLKNNSGQTPLLQAAFSGKLDVIKFLISSGSDMNAVDEDNDTLLHIVASKGHKDIIEYLIPFITDINLKNNSGQNPAFAAAFNGKLDILEFLIGKGADITILNEDGDTLLHAAAEKGHKEVIQFLSPFISDINAKNFLKQTPLFHAVYSGKLDVIEFLIARGSDIKSLDEFGNTLLHSAALGGHTNVIQYLISYISDINVVNNDGHTPLIHGIHSGKLDVVEFLIKIGSDITTVDVSGYSVLHNACKTGHTHIIQYLLPLINHINLKNYSGQTPLFLATWHGHLDAVKFLINKGSDTTLDEDGNTSLHIAAYNGHKDILQYLLSFITDVNLKNHSGETPLQTAVLNGKLEVIQLLIDNGSDIKITDEAGNTLLHTATQHGHINIIQYLISFIDINIKNYSGETSLFEAVSIGELDVIEFLISKGSDITTVDGDGNTLLHIAAGEGHKGIVKFLIPFTTNLNLKNNLGYTPLSMAVFNGKLDVIQFLIHSGSDVKTIDEYGNTLLHIAALTEDINIIQYLIPFYQDLNVRNNIDQTPLTIALLNAKLDVIKILIGKGSDITTVDEDGDTLLHIAAGAGHKDIVQYLIQFTTDLNVKNNLGHTPLSKAVYNEKLDVMQFLIDSGSDVKIIDKDGNTLLHTAALCEDTNIIQYLIPFNFDINLKNNSGQTPLFLANLFGNLDLIQILISNGSDINTVDNLGNTLLHAAAAVGHTNITQYLLPIMNAINVKNNAGTTPLHLAMKSGKLDVVKCFINNGANPMCLDNNGLTCIDYANETKCLDIINYFESRTSENIPNTQQKTPTLIGDQNKETSIHSAAIKGNLAAVKLLIENGANAKSVENGLSCMDCAAKAGAIDIMQYLMQFYKSINTKNAQGETPLHYAANLETVDFLIRKGADPMIANEDGATCLHCAAQKGDVEIVNYLIQRNTNLVNAKNRFDETPLHYAIKAGELEAVKLLVSNAAEVNVNNDKTNCLNYAIKTGFIDIIEYLLLHNDENNQALAPLHMAAINGELEVVKFLIDKGMDPLSEDEDESTALHYAAKRGYVKIIEYLVEHSDDINVKNNSGATPLHYAVQGQLEAVKFLLKNGANSSSIDYDESTCLHYAASAGITNIIQHLIKLNNNLNTVNCFGLTPLHIAVTNNKIEAVKLLIDNGADPTCIEDNGISCLHIAAERGFVKIIQRLMPHIKDIDVKSTLGATPLHYAARKSKEIVKILIENRADPTAADYGGFTCIHHAAQAGNTEAINYLLAQNHRGLDINERNYLGATPLHYAVDGNLETVELLVKHGANTNVKDANESTTLHYAAKSGIVEIIKYLINQNVDLNARNCFGLTPLHIAAKNGNLNTVKILLDYHADSKIKDINELTCMDYACKFGHKNIIEYFNNSNEAKQ